MKKNAEFLVNSTSSEYPVLVVEEIKPNVIAFGGDDCYITFWNFEDNLTLGKYFGHAGSLTLLAMDQGVLMSGGGDYKIKFWKVTDAIVSKEELDEEEMQIKLGVSP